MHSLTLGDLIAAIEQAGHVDCSGHSRLRFWKMSRSPGDGELYIVTIGVGF